MNVNTQKDSQDTDQPHYVFSDSLLLDSGYILESFTIAYQSWGQLNADKSNVVLVCHALTGDQYVTGKNLLTGKAGWWSRLVGEGKLIDTNKYFVICSNILGGCSGSTGPMSINPRTGKVYGLDFPVITVRDMVHAQAMLIDALGIETLFCVIGGSMGGMQVIQWGVSYSERVFSAIFIATSSRQSAQNIAFHEVGRQAILSDPDWQNGQYIEKNVIPRKGLAIARMVAHITYLSEIALTRKFGRNLQNRQSLSYAFEEEDFQIQSYLRYQGSTFVERFDANSYLYITRAMAYFDIASQYNGVLAYAFRDTSTRFCVMSFTGDWLFPTSESRVLVHALNGAGANVSFVEIESDKGHDAFLLDEPEMLQTLSGFIEANAKRRKLG